MVKALLGLLALIRRAWLLELVGAALIVAAVAVQWGTAAGLGASGACLVLKAFELDSRGGP